MPLSRYQIRNEYSLADPELYRAADKDDPESLLEGVAMAGLVGVLRQLGDLAEFAAELFHDLHEEVMVTAARGHSLIVRVQQLEAEIPAVEKAFLSQTTHSSFLCNPGIVWHPKMRVEQNLVMSGDLPRFIMDSYEECRGPPRLFLLDKFDVAGAGACLKRYTDPSFFKLEMSSSVTPGKDIQRERKIRKAKKKGSRWRNGETPEVLSMSHAKLHQLFLEERIENGITDPARRVKLRKRLNGFPFDTKSGKSYMERFLKSPSPDHNEVHDILVDSSPLLLQPNGSYESVSEIAKIKTITLEKESNERLTSPSPVKEETYQINSSAEKLNEISGGTRVSDSGLQAFNVPSIVQAGNSEKVFPVDGGSSESAGDYKSDDIGSEVEQYMDALTTIDSEIDTDTEFKAKSKLQPFDKRRQVSDFDVNDCQIQAISSESQSLGHSTLSDDGNSSSKKGVSVVSSSDTQCLSVASDGEVSSIVFPCNHQLEVHDTTSIAQPTVAVKNTISQAPGGTLSDDVSTGIAEYPHLSSELDNRSSDSIPLDLAAYNKSTDLLETGKAPVDPEADNILPFMSLNTATTNTTQPPARDDPPSCNQFMDGFEVENPETGQNICFSSFPICDSNSEDKSSFRNMLCDHVNKIDSEFQNLDENVASDSCFLVDPADATGENAPTHTNQNETGELEGEDLNLSPKASLQSNIYDVALKPKEDSSREMLGRNTPTGEFGSIQPNSFVKIATDKSNGQSPNCLLEARSAKDHHGQYSDEGQLGQQSVVIPYPEEHHLDPVASEVDNNCPSTGEMSLNATAKTNTVGESVEYVVQNAVLGLRSEQLKQGTSDSEDEHLERPSVTMDAAIMKREASCDIDMLETNCTSSPSSEGENLAQVHFTVPNFGAERESVESTYNGSEIHPDSPLVRLKQEISGSEEEHIERFSDTEDASLRWKADCNLNHLEVDSTPIPSLLGDDVKVHLAVPSNAVESEKAEDADGSSIDLKNSVEESLPAFEDEYIGPEAEKTSPLDGHLKSSVAHDPLDNISALNAVDDFALSDRGRSDDILDQHFASDNMLSDNNISVQSSAKQDECEAFFDGEKVDPLSQHLDETLPSKVKELLTQAPQILCSEETDCVTRADALSEPFLESLSSQPVVSECLSQENNDVDVPGQTMSILSNSFLLPSTSHVTVEEMPPLPPLPPVQWRINKLQHDLSAQHNAETFPQDTLPLNVVTEPSNLDRKRSSPVSEHTTEEVTRSSRSIMQMAPAPDHGDSKEDKARLAFVPHLPAVSAPENHQMASRTNSVVDELRPWSEPSDATSVESCDTRRLPSRMEDELPQHAIRDSDSWPTVEKSMLYTSEVIVKANLGEERLKEGSPLPQQVNVMTDGTTSQQIPSMTLKDQPQHAVSTMVVGPLLWPAVENDHKENGSVHMKLPRPRNPLIDAVVALDKSKLRKVTEHARPEVKKGDDKNSILEQIRTKSFNLKPAVVSRPSIQGPATNLKVAAILEKAKTIRQAFAGSDEDEDNDSWSDS